MEFKPELFKQMELSSLDELRCELNHEKEELQDLSRQGLCINRRELIECKRIIIGRLESLLRKRTPLLQ